MDNRSSRSKSPTLKAQWEVPCQDGSFGSTGSPGSTSTESSYAGWPVGREPRKGNLAPDYMNTPRFTCKSPLDSVVNAAHKAFNGCFKKKKQRAVKAAITSIQGQCARNVEGQSSKRGYLRRQETLCNCIEESLNSRKKPPPDRELERSPSSKKITVEIKEHINGARGGGGGGGGGSGIRHRSNKDPKYTPLTFARKSMQPSLSTRRHDNENVKGGGGKSAAPTTTGRFRKKKTRSLSEDLGRAPRFEHSWVHSRSGIGAAA